MSGTACRTLNLRSERPDSRNRLTHSAFSSSVAEKLFFAGAPGLKAMGSDFSFIPPAYRPRLSAGKNAAYRMLTLRRWDPYRNVYHFSGCVPTSENLDVEGSSIARSYEGQTPTLTPSQPSTLQ